MVRFNDNNEIIRDDEYNAIIVGLQMREDISYSMDELENLAEADGVNVLGRVVQILDRPNTATFIGGGKAEEIAEMCRNMEADTVIFNDELSGVQMRNLEDITGVRVIDRTVLILDIFAKRASTKEGKLQIELAQLQYRLPRLTGFGKALSRLGGGIGTRGPGEKKLETDRRHISARIDDIKSELRKAEKVRSTQRLGREKNDIPVVALVGYTNSGKSTVMNGLLSMSQREDKAVMSKDMLFASLDTQHRKISFERGCEFILIDTVGFVSKLPHSLVESFKSTLEEVRYADLLVHIVDGAYSERDFQIEVTNDVINQIGASGTEKLTVYNKADIAEYVPEEKDMGDVLYVSAKTGEGMDMLAEKIKDCIFKDRVKTEFLIPYDRGDIISRLCDKADVISMEHENEGTRIKGRFSREDFNRYKEFQVKG